MSTEDDKLLPLYLRMHESELEQIRQALYDAKLAFEQDFDGPQRAQVVRQIIDALDVTALVKQRC